MRQAEAKMVQTRLEEQNTTRSHTSRFKQYRSDTRGIKALAKSLIEGEDPKKNPITETERIIFKQEAEAKAKQYLDRGEAPKPYLNKDDARGTLQSFYLTESYEAQKKEKYAVTEQERIDIGQRAKQDAAKMYKERDKNGYNSKTFKGTGILRTDLYNKAALEEYRRLTLSEKKLSIVNEFANIKELANSGVQKDLDTALASVQWLSDTIAEEQDEYIRTNMEIFFQAEAVQLPAIVGDNIRKQTKRAQDGAVADLTNSVINRVYGLTDKSSLEELSLALEQLNSYDGDIRRVTGDKQTAAPKTTASLKEILYGIAPKIIKRTAIQHGDSFGSYINNTPESLDNLYYLIRDAGLGGKIPKGEIRNYNQILDRLGIVKDGERQVSVDEYRYDRTLAGAAPIFVRQINHFRAMGNAGVDAMTRYEANFWDDADRGLREAGWTETETRRRLVDDMQKLWDALKQKAEDEMRIRDDSDEELLLERYAHEQMRQNRINAEVDFHKANNLPIPQELLQAINTFGDVRKPGSKQYELDILERDQLVKDSVAYNDVLRMFVQTGNVKAIYSALQKYSVLSTNVYGEPGYIPNYYSVNQNERYGRTRIYNDDSLLKASRQFEEFYNGMNDNERMAWELQVTGADIISPAEIEFESDGRKLSQLDRGMLFLQRQRGEYIKAYENTKGSALGERLFKNVNEYGIPLTEDQSGYYNDILGEMIKEGNRQDAMSLMKAFKGVIQITNAPANVLEDHITSTQEMVPKTPYIEQDIVDSYLEGNGEVAKAHRHVKQAMFGSVLFLDADGRDRYSSIVANTVIYPYIQRIIKAGGNDEKIAEVMTELNETINGMVLPDGTPNIPGRAVSETFTLPLKEGVEYPDPRNYHEDPDTIGQRLQDISMVGLSYTEMLEVMHENDIYKNLIVSDYDEDADVYSDKPFNRDDRNHLNMVRELVNFANVRVNVVNTTPTHDVVEFIIVNEDGTNLYKYDGATMLMQVPIDTKAVRYGF